MKKLCSVFLMIALPAFMLSQKPKTQPKAPASTDINKMMEEAMKDLTPEQRQMMKDMMKNKMQSSPAANNQLVPPKQTELLAKIPKFINDGQFNLFVTKMQQQAEKNIEPASISAVKNLFLKIKNDPVAVNNFPFALLMQKQVKAAVYASILCMQQNNNLLSKSNMAFMLQQAGYPQYALPVLEYLLTKSSNPVLYNNAGQCYFSLGDTTKARMMFAACLKNDPDNAEAHTTTAIMLIEQKKLDAAKDHIAKAFQNGYSHELEDYVTKQNVKLKFDDIRKKQVPSYFSPQKYKVVPPAKTLKEVITKYDALNELDNEVNAAFRKAEISKQIFNNNDANWQMKFVNNSFRGPFKRKAAFMLFILQRAFIETIYEQGSSLMEAKAQTDAALNKMNQAIDNEYKTGSISSMYEDCKMKEKHLVEYLNTTLPIQDAIERKFNYKFFNLVNEDMYWFVFLLNDQEYKAQYDQLRHQVLTWIKGISDIQRIYPAPINIASGCDKILENPPKEDEGEEDVNKECPFTLKIPFGVGSAKMDCNGWELEATEIVALSIEKNYTTGDFTVAFGLGVSAELKAFEAGVKGQVYFTVNDWEATDMGLRGEAKVEVNTGINPVEEGVKGAIGISGANANALHNGKEINIFSYDPTK
jgi:tetratricopeptide (TPR) repeat protein